MFGLLRRQFGSRICTPLPSWLNLSHCMQESPNSFVNTFYGGHVCLILFLYLLHLALLRRPRNLMVRVGIFGLAVFLSIPFLYYVSQEWNSRFLVSTLAIYIGEPVMFLTIPALSFFVDSYSRTKSWPLYLLVWRWIGEVVILLPLWVMGCSWAMLCMQWYWI